MRDIYTRAQHIVTKIDEDTDVFGGAVIPPTFENTIYRYPDFDTVVETNKGAISRYSYGKNRNPTTDALESKLAALEKGEASRCFASGTAAIYTTLLSILNQDSHVITINNVYGRVSDFLRNVFAKFGVESTFVPGDQLEDFSNAIQANTKLIYLESPTSWHFELQDIRTIMELAKKHNLKVVMDNTWATPIFQNPLEYGVDAVIHSASKYLGGHSDLVAGVVVASREFIANLPQIGAVLSPYESNKLLKGLRTLPLRMERHENNANIIADYLDKEHKISVVHYPGLHSFRQYELAVQQMKGCSGLMSFELESDKEGVKRFINSLRHISIGGSWGGFESVIYAAAMSGEDKELESRGFGITQVRLSVGLEDSTTLLEDIHGALQSV
ncbi:trans-sulfuration enzyme family protein [Paenibacillus agricola]|uniref:Aminotransferase class I/II-fold pyridoxal phosphate-dependent enzyme n=1 Tax=Paenibacillus agricola TaxID=2716264 RepID=A0ABX0JBZ8_9BACL|nr:aminotransferase class I/II-fold pyridoxal phosphate-dependent enzyme [Paenibacillus agricola]NHN32761.1 aminotransferase class I/II-fold pyridoxal phosphate-dependent enzyme [Paenibacillus agricola]